MRIGIRDLKQLIYLIDRRIDELRDADADAGTVHDVVLTRINQWARLRSQLDKEMREGERRLDYKVNGQVMRAKVNAMVAAKAKVTALSAPKVMPKVS